MGLIIIHDHGSQLKKKIKSFPKTAGSLLVLSWNLAILWRLLKYREPALWRRTIFLLSQTSMFWLFFIQLYCADHILSTAGDALSMEIGQARLHCKSIQSVCDIQSICITIARFATSSTSYDENLLVHWMLAVTVGYRWGVSLPQVAARAQWIGCGGRHRARELAEWNCNNIQPQIPCATIKPSEPTIADWSMVARVPLVLGQCMPDHTL